MSHGPPPMSVAQLAPCLAIAVGPEGCGAEEWLWQRATELHREGRQVLAVVDRLARRPAPFSCVAIDPRRGINWFEALATIEPRDVLLIESICDRSTLNSAVAWACRGVLVLTWCRGLDSATTHDRLADMAEYPDIFRSHAVVFKLMANTSTQ